MARRIIKRQAGAVDTVNDAYREEDLQAAIVANLESELAARPGAFAFAAGLEGVRLRPSQRAKMRAQGMTAGEPDLRFYLPGGRTLLIELKAGAAVSRVQKDRHALIRGLGFVVHVVRAKTPAEAVAAVRAILAGEGVLDG